MEGISRRPEAHQKKQEKKELINRRLIITEPSRSARGRQLQVSGSRRARSKPCAAHITHEAHAGRACQACTCTTDCSWRSIQSKTYMHACAHKITNAEQIDATTHTYPSCKKEQHARCSMSCTVTIHKIYRRRRPGKFMINSPLIHN